MKNKFIVGFVIFVIAVIIQFLPVYVSKLTFFARDLTFLFHPWRVFAAECIQKGSLPLWNPYAYCGMPFMANMQTAIWYPFTILFYFFPFVISLKIYHLFHYALAGYFSFLLARKCNINFYGSLIAGILFSLNGYMITKIEFLSILGSAIWFPLMILFNRKYIFIGLIVTLAYWAGYPQLVLLQMLGVLLVLFIFYKSFTNNVKYYVVGGFFAVLLSAVQLIPAIELFKHSIRGGGLSLQDIGIYSLKLRDFLGFIMPYLVPNHQNQLLGEKIFWINGMHIGIIGLYMVLNGFLKMHIKQKLYICISVLILILISLGTNTILFSWLYRFLPFVKVYRFPSLYIYILTILTIFLSMKYLIEKKYILKYLLMLLFMELSCINFMPYPVVNPGYFHHQDETVKYLKENSGRYLLSPKTQNEIGVWVQNSSHGWYVLKERLYGQSGLPYHLDNAGGFGEPLVLKTQDTLLQNIYSASNLDDALKKSSSADIRYILCSYPVEKKYNPAVMSDGMNVVPNPYLKENTLMESHGFTAVAPINYPPLLRNAKQSGGGNFLHSAECKKLKMRSYPGWRIYHNGKRILNIEDKNGWIKLPEDIGNNGLIYYKYVPMSYYMGLALSLAAIIFITIKGYLYLSKISIFGDT